jgi:hypothetical protein
MISKEDELWLLNFWKEIKNEIDNKSLTSKIDFLVENPDLGPKNYNSFLGFHKSNCLGTALYVNDIGSNKRLFYVSHEKFSPYFDSDLFENDKKLGSIIYYDSNNETNLKSNCPYHYAVYLFTHHDYDFIFEQNGFGGKFGFWFNKPVNDKNYYFPKSNLLNDITNSLYISTLNHYLDDEEIRSTFQEKDSNYKFRIDGLAKKIYEQIDKIN